MNRFSVVIAVAISAASIVPTACASTWISNLDQPLRPVGCGFAGSSWCANFFTTDGAPYILDGATLRVATQNRPLHVQVLLFDDTDGLPGSLVETLIGTPYVSKPYNQGYTDISVTSSGSELSENTTYWLVASSTTRDPGVWAFTNSTNSTSPGSWSMGSGAVTFDGGEDWGGSAPNYAHLFSVDATLIPEPSTLVLLLMGVVGLLVYISHKCHQLTPKNYRVRYRV